jgi:hypothetical protein
MESKKEWLKKRIYFALRQTPKRWIRLFTYPFSPFYFAENGGSRLRSFPFLLIDSLFLFDIYEITTNLYKKSTRPLTKREILRGHDIFGDSVDYNLVMIDTRAEMLTKSMGVIYVSGNTINSWGAFPDDYLIHELVHVWQYQHFGAGYAACALKAQDTEAGYNYTFLTPKKGHKPQNTEITLANENEADEGVWFQKKSFLNFNAEQQGDLVQDYFKIKNGQRPEWCDFDTSLESKLEKYILEMKAKSVY